MLPLVSYDLHLQGSGPITREKATPLLKAASSLPGEPLPMWEPPLGLDLEEACESLQEMIDEGEIRADDFRHFCRTHSLVDHIDPPEPNAAATFLLHFWGCPLVSLHLGADANDARATYRQAIEFARRHDLELHDPQLGDEIDLDNPGDLPPGYC
jgi:hypothetical protein